MNAILGKAIEWWKEELSYPSMSGEERDKCKWQIAEFQKFMETYISTLDDDEVRIDGRAKIEVDIAISEILNDTSEDADDLDKGYAIECYKSALKAYSALIKSLDEDGHSGCSFGITRNIIKKLLYEQPLTPITEDDFVEIEPIGTRADKTTYQCSRYSSLFKDVYDDGRVKYRDLERAVKVYEPTETTWHCRTADEIVDELFGEITMPYMPSEKKYMVYMTDFDSVRNRIGVFDTEAVFYVVTPRGERVDVEKFFKEEDGGMVEISRDEFVERFLSKPNSDDAYLRERDDFILRSIDLG